MTFDDAKSKTKAKKPLRDEFLLGVGEKKMPSEQQNTPARYLFLSLNHVNITSWCMDSLRCFPADNGCRQLPRVTDEDEPFAPQRQGDERAQLRRL